MPKYIDLEKLEEIVGDATKVLHIDIIPYFTVQDRYGEEFLTDAGEEVVKNVEEAFTEILEDAEKDAEDLETKINYLETLAETHEGFIEKIKESYIDLAKRVFSTVILDVEKQEEFYRLLDQYAAIEEHILDLKLQNERAGCRLVTGYIE